MERDNNDEIDESGRERIAEWEIRELSSKEMTDAVVEVHEVVVIDSIDFKRTEIRQDDRNFLIIYTR